MSTMTERHRARAAANRATLRAVPDERAELEARLTIAIDAALAKHKRRHWFKLLVVACFFAGVALAKKLGV